MNEIEMKDLVYKLSWEYPKEEHNKAVNQLSVFEPCHFCYMCYNKMTNLLG